MYVDRRSSRVLPTQRAANARGWKVLMATRNGSNAAAKSRRDGRRAVAYARSSARSGTGWWIAASGIVALVLLLTIARSIGGQRTTSQTKGPDINDPAATIAVGGYTT